MDRHIRDATVYHELLQQPEVLQNPQLLQRYLQCLQRQSPDASSTWHTQSSSSEESVRSGVADFIRNFQPTTVSTVPRGPFGAYSSFMKPPVVTSSSIPHHHHDLSSTIPPPPSQYQREVPKSPCDVLSSGSGSGRAVQPRMGVSAAIADSKKERRYSVDTTVPPPNTPVTSSASTISPTVPRDEDTVAPTVPHDEDTVTPTVPRDEDTVTPTVPRDEDTVAPTVVVEERMTSAAHSTNSRSDDDDVTTYTSSSLTNYSTMPTPLTPIPEASQEMSSVCVSEASDRTATRASTTISYDSTVFEHGGSTAESVFDMDETIDSQEKRTFEQKMREEDVLKRLEQTKSGKERCTQSAAESQSEEQSIVSADQAEKEVPEVVTAEPEEPAQKETSGVSAPEQDTVAVNCEKEEERTAVVANRKEEEYTVHEHVSIDEEHTVPEPVSINGEHTVPAARPDEGHTVPEPVSIDEVHTVPEQVSINGEHTVPEPDEVHTVPATHDEGHHTVPGARMHKQYTVTGVCKEEEYTVPESVSIGQEHTVPELVSSDGKYTISFEFINIPSEHKEKQRRREVSREPATLVHEAAVESRQMAPAAPAAIAAQPVMNAQEAEAANEVGRVVEVAQEPHEQEHHVAEVAPSVEVDQHGQDPQYSTTSSCSTPIVTSPITRSQASDGREPRRRRPVAPDATDENIAQAALEADEELLSEIMVKEESSNVEARSPVVAQITTINQEEEKTDTVHSAGSEPKLEEQEQPEEMLEMTTKCGVPYRFSPPRRTWREEPERTVTEEPNSSHELPITVARVESTVEDVQSIAAVKEEVTVAPVVSTVNDQPVVMEETTVTEPDPVTVMETTVDAPLSSPTGFLDKMLFTTLELNKDKIARDREEAERREREEELRRFEAVERAIQRATEEDAAEERQRRAEDEARMQREQSKATETPKKTYEQEGIIQEREENEMRSSPVQMEWPSSASMSPETTTIQEIDEHAAARRSSSSVIGAFSEFSCGSGIFPPGSPTINSEVSSSRMMSQSSETTYSAVSSPNEKMYENEMRAAIWSNGAAPGAQSAPWSSSQGAPSAPWQSATPGASWLSTQVAPSAPWSSAQGAPGAPFPSTTQVAPSAAWSSAQGAPVEQWSSAMPQQHTNNNMQQQQQQFFGSQPVQPRGAPAMQHQQQSLQQQKSMMHQMEDWADIANITATATVGGSFSNATGFVGFGGVSVGAAGFGPAGGMQHYQNSNSNQHQRPHQHPGQRLTDGTGFGAQGLGSAGSAQGGGHNGRGHQAGGSRQHFRPSNEGGRQGNARGPRRDGGGGGHNQDPEMLIHKSKSRNDGKSGSFGQQQQQQHGRAPVQLEEEEW